MNRGRQLPFAAIVQTHFTIFSSGPRFCSVDRRRVAFSSRSIKSALPKGRPVCVR